MTGIALLLLTALPAQTPATLWASPAKAEVLVKVDLAQQKMLEALADVAMQEALGKLPQPQPQPEPSPTPPEPELPPQPLPTYSVPLAQPVTYYTIPQYHFAPSAMPMHSMPVQNYQPPCLPGR